MTNRLDRLEKRGFLRREPDPHDRRGVRAVLTDEGRAAVDASLDDLLAQEREILAALGNDERVDLARMLRSLITPFDNASD